MPRALRFQNCANLEQEEQMLQTPVRSEIADRISHLWIGRESEIWNWERRLRRRHLHRLHFAASQASFHVVSSLPKTWPLVGARGRQLF